MKLIVTEIMCGISTPRVLEFDTREEANQVYDQQMSYWSKCGKVVTVDNLPKFIVYLPNGSSVHVEIDPF